MYLSRDPLSVDTSLAYTLPTKEDIAGIFFRLKQPLSTDMMTIHTELSTRAEEAKDHLDVQTITDMQAQISSLQKAYMAILYKVENQENRYPRDNLLV